MTHGWRRRDARALYDRHTGPNMTPMVDVVLVILIFFMASTVIMGPELLLQAGLGRTANREGKADPRFAITAPTFTVRLHTDAGRVVVSGLGLDAAALDRLGPAARALAGEVNPAAVSVSLVPEDSVPYEAVVRVQDTLTAAGFEKIKLR